MEVPTPAPAPAASSMAEEDEEHEEHREDVVTAVANVAMTPLSVIASTCLQVTLSSSDTRDKPLAFSLLTASVIATAGMLMAVYLVTARSCSSPESRGKNKPPFPPERKTAAAAAAKKKSKKSIVALLVKLECPVDDKERHRVARMMLRCLWFSLSYMTTGVLCRALKNHLELSDGATTGVAVGVWIVFLWSCFGAPLPRFNRWLKLVGSVFTVAFPVLLMAAYAGLLLSRAL